MSACFVPLQVEKWKIRQILFQIGKNVYGDFPELEKNSWARYIKSGGEYFEGDKFD
jgi:hypothetical protein